MLAILTDARIAQRDASRKLYFVAAGCLYHPLGHLVTDGDPEGRAVLEQAVQTARRFAELSDDEAAALRERAVAATRVIETKAGTYTFEQPDRPPRRRRRLVDFLRVFVSSSPPEMADTETGEARPPQLVLRVLGTLTAAWLLYSGARMAAASFGAMASRGVTLSEVIAAALGLGIAALAVILILRLLSSALP